MAVLFASSYGTRVVATYQLVEYTRQQTAMSYTREGSRRWQLQLKTSLDT